MQNLRKKINNALIEIARTGHLTERTLHGANIRIETERAGRHLPRPYAI